MGLTLNKIAVQDYINKKLIYSKLVRGKLDFTIEAKEDIDSGTLFITLLRNHPRIKDFIEANKTKNHLTQQTEEIEVGTTELRLIINEDDFMINTSPSTKIKILEYNFNKDLKDFKKGKVAIYLEIKNAGGSSNIKIIEDLKKKY